MYRSIVDKLIKSGFLIIQTNLNGIMFLCKQNETKIDIVAIVNQDGKASVSGDKIQEIKSDVERKFYLEYHMREVNILFLIVSDDVGRDRILTQVNVNMWLYDTLGDQLIVYENQPDDFCMIRGILESKMVRESRMGIHRNQEGKIKIDWSKCPVITIILLVMNVGIFAVLKMIGDTTNAEFMLNHGAILPEKVLEDGELYRMVFAMFLHFGIIHLVNNMLILYLIGEKAEIIMGKVKFTCAYFFAGICGSLLSAIAHQGKLVVSAGASGAIYGILGAFVIYSFINSQVRNRSFAIRTGMIVLLMAYSTLSVGQTGGSQVDIWDHMGGFVGGFVLTAVWSLIDQARYRHKHRY